MSENMAKRLVGTGTVWLGLVFPCLRNAENELPFSYAAGRWGVLTVHAMLTAAQIVAFVWLMVIGVRLVWGTRRDGL